MSDFCKLKKYPYVEYFVGMENYCKNLILHIQKVHIWFKDDWRNVILMYLYTPLQKKVPFKTFNQ